MLSEKVRDLGWIVPRGLSATVHRAIDEKLDALLERLVDQSLPLWFFGDVAADGQLVG